MKSTLFWKLFGLQMLGTCMLLGGALGVMRFYTVSSFTTYIEAQDQLRLQEAAQRISMAATRNGDLVSAAISVVGEPHVPRRAQPDEPGPPPRGDGQDDRPFREDGQRMGPPHPRPPPPRNDDGMNEGPPPRQQPMHYMPAASDPVLQKVSLSQAAQDNPPPLSADDRPARRPAALQGRASPRRPIQVRDLQGNIVAGDMRPFPPGGEFSAPILINDRIIGYAASPRATPT